MPDRISRNASMIVMERESPFRPGPTTHHLLRQGRRARLVFLGLWALGGCRPTPPMTTSPAGLVDAERVAARALSATLPQSPVQMSFGFRVREADFRFEGKGIARVEPPYRVRIDLFSNGGETLFTAALVGDDLRVPAWAPRELAPPPGLLWAALGVFRPDPGWRLLGARPDGKGVVILGYESRDGDELRFRLLDDKLTRAELYTGGHLAEDVDLSLDEASGRVVETVYRDLAEFLELTFSLESVTTVESFPPTIWNPGR